LNLAGVLMKLPLFVRQKTRCRFQNSLGMFERSKPCCSDRWDDRAGQL